MLLRILLGGLEGRGRGRGRVCGGNGGMGILGVGDRGVGNGDNEWFIETSFMHAFLLCCYYVVIQVIFDVHARFSAKKALWSHERLRG